MTRAIARHTGALLFYAVLAIVVVRYPALIGDAIVAFWNVAEAIVHVVAASLHLTSTSR